MRDNGQQRSSKSLWLLVVIPTLIADVVATYWYAHSLDDISYTLCFGVIFAQLNLVCAWLVFGTNRWIVRVVTFFAALAIAVLIVTYVEGAWSSVRQELAMLGLPLVGLLPCLILARLLGVSPKRASSFRGARQDTRYTVSQLLAWTTFIAIATMVGTWANLPELSGLRVAHILLFATLVPLVSIVTCWSLPWASAASMAFLTAVVIVPISLEMLQEDGWLGVSIIDIIAINLIQAIVLIPWLSVWRTTARRQAAGNEEPAPPSPES